MQTGNLEKLEQQLDQSDNAEQIIHMLEDELLANTNENDLDKNHQTLCLLGKAYSKSGDFKKSVFYFTKALQVKSDAMTYYSLAREYFRIDSIKQSRLFLEKAMSQDAKRPEFLILLAEVEFKSENFSSALKILKLLADRGIEGTINAGNQMLRFFIQKSMYAEVIQLAEIAIQNGQAGYEHFEAMGVAYLRTGRHKEALKFLEQSRKMHPMTEKYPIPSYEQKKKALGNIPEKIAKMEKEVKLEKDKRESSNQHFDLGFLYYYNGEHERALHTFQKALDLRLKVS